MSTEYMINRCLESINRAYRFEFHVVDMREKDLNLLSVLSERELEHLETLKIEKNRIQWISGRYAVKSALFKYKLDRGVMMDLSCIDVLKNDDSSPCIIQYPELCLSITHSFPYCIGLVSDNKIGIDLESTESKKESLIKHFYTLEEQQFLNGYEGKDNYWEQAMILWTRKEAISKLFKLGMRMSFNKLCTLKDTVEMDNCSIALKSFVCGEFALSVAVAY